MKYKDAVRESMEMLAKEENAVFIGYNLAFGSKGYGTLINVPREHIVETPVAENLMTGLAMGLSLEGIRPVLIFERHDFMLNALDALVNHLGRFEELSDGEYKMPVIIRAIIGGTKPFYPGPQHVQDYTNVFRDILSFPVSNPQTSEGIIRLYQEAQRSDRPFMIVEKRDLYDLNV